MLGRTVALMSHRPRHMEVDQQHTTGFESNNQILAASLEGRDGLSSSSAATSRGSKGRVTRGSRDLDTVKPLTDEEGFEASANSLDLGQLGHGARPSRGLAGQVYVSVSRTTPPGGGASSASS